MRIKYNYRNDSLLFAETLTGEKITVQCTDSQQQELVMLSPFLQEGNLFNLVYPQFNDQGQWEADLFVFEPDYLLDISSLAECFRPYGNHPLNYLLSRLLFKENTVAILLGNAANFMIDELINEVDEFPVTADSVLKKIFRHSPFELTACEDLKDPQKAQSFFTSCYKHFEHIRQVVRQTFPKQGIDRRKVVLEPSFISNGLGLQGRLDLMSQDYSAFVELKSGKGVENFHAGGIFMHSAVNHYTQMILYLAVLELNLQLQAERVNSYLLYSKYPVLSKEAHSRVQLQKAIRLRNSIVSLEYGIQRNNDSKYTEQIVNQINSSVLNTALLSGRFFDTYLRPSIDKTTNSVSLLSELEKSYYMRIYTFITKELWLSKVGDKEYEGTKRAANLWNVASHEKIEAGELLYDLQLLDNRADSEEHTVLLKIPENDTICLPNFRSGDAVVLYVRNTDIDTVNNRQVFKGSIERLDSSEVELRLRYRQRNRHVLPMDQRYALEHDYMDSTYTGMFRSLTAFSEANQERRDLLLGQRMPDFDSSLSKSNLSEDGVKRIVTKAMANPDCFLLIGPPGTGKTSLVLKQLVETCLAKENQTILLLSYTNRAVDEICKALVSISNDLFFIRVGSELNCAGEYRSYLLDNQLKLYDRRSEVEDLMKQCRIITGTVASIWNKSELFRLKQFDLLIVDEATQLLEPHLLGVLCSKTKSGQNSVKQFVLIGDHKQLPAVVLQSKEESKVNDGLLQQNGIFDLSCSLFERLYRKYKQNDIFHAFDTLFKQGRMHPVIASFPSAFFYEGKLSCVGLPHQCELVEKVKHSDSLCDLVKKQRLIFVPVEMEATEKLMKSNSEEAAAVAKLVRILRENCIEQGLPFNVDTLGIITPYRNQIALIRSKLLELNIPECSSIVVDTIERFQGSQKEVIIYSFCVNTRSQLDSLPNMIEDNGQLIDRKLNVVLTRAKKQLIMVGNRVLLSQNQLYYKLIQHVELQGVISCQW